LQWESHLHDPSPFALPTHFALEDSAIYFDQILFSSSGPLLLPVVLAVLPALREEERRVPPDFLIRENYELSVSSFICNFLYCPIIFKNILYICEKTFKIGVEIIDELCYYIQCNNLQKHYKLRNCDTIS